MSPWLEPWLFTLNGKQSLNIFSLWVWNFYIRFPPKWGTTELFWWNISFSMNENVTFSSYKLLLRHRWAQQGYRVWRSALSSSDPGLASNSLSGESHTWITSLSCQLFITHLFLCIFEEIDSFVWPYINIYYINIYFLGYRIWFRNDYYSSFLKCFSTIEREFSQMLFLECLLSILKWVPMALLVANQ